MATLTTSPPNVRDTIADNASDYGSDIDDETANTLLSQAESSQPLQDVVLESIEDPLLKDDGSGGGDGHALLHVPRAQCSPHIPSENGGGRVRSWREISVEVEYDEGNRTAFSPSNSLAEAPSAAEASRREQVPATENDARAPLARFRARRPLSVTDLVSPAWCEQQYAYSLSKYGRVRQTPAMKQGSSVHKELEEQVHVRVPVEVVSKEDRFGLRLWNTIQGLRTLRHTGLTRELEVWGVLDGEVVIGIIDEIGTQCPDEGMEARILEAADAAKGKKGKKEGDVGADQRTLTEFLTGSQSAAVLEKNPAFLGSLRERPRTYYIVDVKTRQSRTLPATGSQSRPTHMQLMIYHRLLSSLAANEVPADRVFERYKLHSDAPFSDTFIQQVASLDMAASPPSMAEDDEEPPTDSLTELLQHNTLSALWTLLITECARTFPPSAAQSRTSNTSLSPLLTAEFRTARPRYISTANAEETSEVLESAGTLIGRRSFAFNLDVVQNYVRDEVRWWRGERETKGVEIEEAFKCRMCEFAEGCAWRANRVEEGLRKARLRGEGRRRSQV